MSHSWRYFIGILLSTMVVEACAFPIILVAAKFGPVGIVGRRMLIFLFLLGLFTTLVAATFWYLAPAFGLYLGFERSSFFLFSILALETAVIGGLAFRAPWNYATLVVGILIAAAPIYMVAFHSRLR